MSNKLVKQLLENRTDFIKHLKADVTKTDQVIEATTAQLNELKVTAGNVKELGKKVEHQSLIPLGKKIYVNGTIVHTGEYYLDKLAFPDSYSTLETLDSTIQHLETKIQKQSQLLEKTENSKEQLLDRIALIEGSQDSNDECLPKEIVSDRGVAVKTGEFYEIIEFEN